MSVSARVKKLELSCRTGGECPGGTTIILKAGAKVPPDAPRCPLCGVPHVLVITTVIVPPPDEEQP